MSLLHLRQDERVTVSYNEENCPIDWPGKVVIQTKVKKNMFRVGKITIFCRGKDQGMVLFIIRRHNLRIL